MTYNQYTNTPVTGYSESVKNRIDNNSNAANSEASAFPTKFDLFVNKENTSIGAYAVTETHTLSQIVGSTLYLDHRPAVDYTGGLGSFVISDGGVIDTTQTDVAGASVEFTTLPTVSPFSISYSAAPDRVQDAHLNSLQNAVMNIETSLGIRSPIGGQGTGIITLPALIAINPRDYATYSALQGIMPNMIMVQHLGQNLVLGSTDVAGIPGYGTGVTISIGSTGVASRDYVIIDTNNFTLRASDSAPATYSLGIHTGESVNISGQVTIASKVVIGLNGGAGFNFQNTVPTGAQAFYTGAALQVHGGVWFGSGLSGNGSVTFVTTTGQSVTVSGELDATSLVTSGPATFGGNTTIHGYVAIVNPGYLVTDNDITLQPKAGGVPSLIDGLDPSYANWAINNPGVPGSITSTVRTPIDTAPIQYSNGAKKHPVYGFMMYPIVGGWSYTGTVNYEKASVAGNRNILLLNANMSGIGPCSTSQSTSVNLGGGTLSSGDYCTGLFNPGDTFIEIKSASDVDAYSYPIYYHTPYLNGSNIVTGLNVYVAADDQALQTSVAGKKYRLYQPGNSPIQHLSGWAGAQVSPLASYGTLSSADYPYATVNTITNPAWLGGNNVINSNAQFKHVLQAGTIGVAPKDALEKSINNITGSINATGIAYVFIAGSNTNSTSETSIQVRCSPTPYGMAGPQMQMGSPRLVPGQHIPVGEILATTTNGTTWTYLDAVSYRPNGVYDSCWVPLVEYKSTSIPAYGRCLPFYSSSIQSDSEYDGGYYQFWVEHNLGPIGHRGELDYHIDIANYGSWVFDNNPGLAGSGQSGTFKLSSQGSQNLWSPYASNLAATNTYYQAQTAGYRGFLKDVTNRFELSYLDTRFAKFIFDSNTADITTFKGHNGRLAGYIRIVMKKIV